MDGNRLTLMESRSGFPFQVRIAFETPCKWLTTRRRGFLPQRSTHQPEPAIIITPAQCLKNRRQSSKAVRGLHVTSSSCLRGLPQIAPPGRPLIKVSLMLPA